MSLRTLPLRFKLSLALVLPMLLVAVLMGERVNSSLDDRRVASFQKNEAERLETFADFANSVGTESVVTNDPTASVEQLAATRARTDAALAQVQDPSAGFDSEAVQAAVDHHGELVEIRAVLGDRPANISLRFQLEAYVDTDADGSNASDTTESVPDALGRLAKLPTTIAAEFEFADAAIVDVETDRLLVDYDLVQRLRDDHVREVSALLQLVSTPPSLVDGAALDKYRTQVTQTDISRSLMYEFASQDVVSDIWASRRSTAGVEYSTLRADADRTGPGVDRVDDIAAVNRSGSVVTSQYAALSDHVVNSVRAQADGTASAATTSLVLVLLAAAWMLVVAGLVLGLLYRAIRAPLQRLTEQSHHIATVELPYVVTAMREGHLDQAPQTTDLVADANDEIGELVAAFNDMHRTAVELAAEQAGSRRVVADMFVNLGRRNQRLVNRLLKRLSVLERDERDPDKLAGLYEIDHVVTRMRRNAESLLVLAGADQSRKWDRPVDIYDVARGAMSEVEAYERVEVIADEDFQVHGDVVADLTHLLAELVENALSFSPPSTQVEVTLGRVGSDHSVRVTDVGVGMTEEKLAEANERIRRAGVEEETPSEFLGHYVIGRLAARHRIKIRLSSGPDGRGVVADVRIPVGAVIPRAEEFVEGFAEELSARMAPVAPVAPPATSVASSDDVETTDWANATREMRMPDLAAAPESQPTPEPAPMSLDVGPTSASFDYPPVDQIDPRQRTTTTPRPAVVDEPANVPANVPAPTLETSRRTPGANLPDTSLLASISGRMTLDIERPASPVSAQAASVPLTAPSPDPNPDELRSQLSSFQSGTSRADREN